MHGLQVPFSPDKMARTKQIHLDRAVLSIQLFYALLLLSDLMSHSLCYWGEPVGDLPWCVWCGISLHRFSHPYSTKKSTHNKPVLGRTEICECWLSCMWKCFFWDRSGKSACTKGDRDRQLKYRHNWSFCIWFWKGWAVWIHFCSLYCLCYLLIERKIKIEGRWAFYCGETNVVLSCA